MNKNVHNIGSLIIILTVGFLLGSCGNISNVQLQKCLDLGQKYMTEMNYEEAIIAYNKALEIDPKNVEAYQVLANIYEFQGDIDQARNTMERALVAVPSNAEIQTRYERLMLISSTDSGTDTGKTDINSVLNSKISANIGNQAGATEEAAIVTSPTEASVKADGWVQINGKWYFYAGGEKATGWMKQGENRFYLDEGGILQHGKTMIEKAWYFFNEDGAMVTGWQEEGGKWYYFGPDGRMLKNQWIEDTYYVGLDGAMLVSTTTPDGQEVDAEGKKVIKLPIAEYLSYMTNPNLYLVDNVFGTGNWTHDENGNNYEQIIFNNPTNLDKSWISANRKDIIDRGSYYEIQNQVISVAEEYDDIESLPKQPEGLEWIGILPNGKYTLVGENWTIITRKPIWEGSFYVRKDALVKSFDKYYNFNPDYYSYKAREELVNWPYGKAKNEKDHVYEIREFDDRGYISVMELISYVDY